MLICIRSIGNMSQGKTMANTQLNSLKLLVTQKKIWYVGTNGLKKKIYEKLMEVQCSS